MLPSDKGSFPKFLYLDQNKWIDLARAHYGKVGGEGFTDALESVRQAVRRRKLVVPLSGVNVMETMGPADEGRRRRLAEFMVELSGNHSILPHMAVRPLEIRLAVAREFVPQKALPVRTQVIRVGLPSALGAQPVVSGLNGTIAKELETHICSPEVSVQCLVDAVDRATIASNRLEDAETVRVLEGVRRQARNDLSGDLRHRVELADLFTSGEPGRELKEALASLGRTSEDLFARFKKPEDWITFFHGVPTVDVLVTLSLERDRDFNRPIHRNDLNDIAFMSMALPYANVIVCEKYWAHIAKSTGLGMKYGTLVSTGIRELPGILESEKCLQ